MCGRWCRGRPPWETPVGGGKQKQQTQPQPQRNTEQSFPLLRFFSSETGKTPGPGPDLAPKEELSHTLGRPEGPERGVMGKQVAPQAASAAILSEDTWHPPRGSTASS